MDKITEAINVLCQAPREVLVKTEGAKTLFTVLKGIYQSSTTLSISTERFQELRDFCKTNGPDEVVGEVLEHDYRLVDVRFADGQGKGKKEDLRRSLRRVMAERSLAEEFKRLYPQRLENVCKSRKLRGEKRNTDSLTTYATANFHPDDKDIVIQATRNGLKALAIEEMDVLPENQRHHRAGFMGLVAISHRQVSRRKFENVVEELKTLSEVPKLVCETSLLMSEAYEVYKEQAPDRQAPDRRASKRQRLCGVRDCRFPHYVHLCRY
jgi:hypothetical protein